MLDIKLGEDDIVLPDISNTVNPMQTLKIIRVTKEKER